jgi:hypothetical protein
LVQWACIDFYSIFGLYPVSCIPSKFVFPHPPQKSCDDDAYCIINIESSQHCVVLALVLFTFFVLSRLLRWMMGLIVGSKLCGGGTGTYIIVLGWVNERCPFPLDCI